MWEEVGLGANLSYSPGLYPGTYVSTYPGAALLTRMTDESDVAHRLS
jgi:hypothetical protein